MLRAKLRMRIQDEALHSTHQRRRAMDRIVRSDERAIRATNYILAALAGGIAACVIGLIFGV